jgi:hypothetical protein
MMNRIFEAKRDKIIGWRKPDNEFYFSFGAIAPIWALAHLHETLRFTTVY